MFYVLLFAAAFLFMTADRKIRTSSVVGSCVTLIPCIVIARWIIVHSRAHVIGFKGSSYTAVFLTAALSILLAAAVILLLYFLGSLLAKAVMPLSKEDSSNRIVASLFYIAGMCLTLISGLRLILLGLLLTPRNRLALNPMLKGQAVKIRHYINDFAVNSSNLQIALFILGVLLLITLSFCIVRIAVRRGLFRDLKAYVKPDKKDLKNNKAILIGEILSGIGVLGTVLISVVCVLTPKGKGRIYFFDGYDYTKILSFLALALMMTGAIFLIVGIIILLAKRQARHKKLTIYIASVLIILSYLSSYIIYLNAAQYIIRNL